jgi:hypothetical protein
MLAEAVGDRYAWPQPFVMEMVECGEVGANWRSRNLKICYEMAQDFAELYSRLRRQAKGFEAAAKEEEGLTSVAGSKAHTRVHATLRLYKGCDGGYKRIVADARGRACQPRIKIHPAAINS